MTTLSPDTCTCARLGAVQVRRQSPLEILIIHILSFSPIITDHQGSRSTLTLFREAIQEFEKVLVSPDHRIKAREMLGRCTFDMKRYDEAEDHFRKGLVLASALDDRSAIVGFHVNLYRVYDFTGRSGHAEAEKKLAVELDPVMAKALQLE